MSTYLSTPRPEPAGALPRLTDVAGKSKKDFKPKAPVRRPAAPTSGQASVRTSVEPQSQSQRQTSQTRGSDAAGNDSRVLNAETVGRQDGQTDDLPAQLETSRSTEASHQIPAGESTARESASRATADVSLPQPAIAVGSRPRVSAGAVPIAIPSAQQRRAIKDIARNDPSKDPPPKRGLVSPTQTRPQNTAQSASRSASERRESIANDVVEPSPKRRRLDSKRNERSTTPVTTTQPGGQEAPGGADGGPQKEPTRSPLSGATRRPKSQKRKAPAQADDEAATDPEKAEAKKAKRIARLQKKVAETTEDAGHDTPQAEKRGSKRRKLARAQSKSEDVRMAELCRDRRIGEKSTREARLEQREKDQKAAKARELLRELMGEGKENGKQSPESTDHAAASKLQKSHQDKRSTPPAPVSLMAPQVRIVNGQIVQDEGSRLIDRHAAAENERQDSDDEIQEDELSRRVNSATYMKRISSFRWTAESTERFYDGLRFFGTDFMMMTAMFPGLSRRHLKLKFAKEERQNEALIKQTLLHERKVVGLEEIQGWTNIVYRDPAEVEKELEEDRKRLEEEDRMEREAKEQLERERDDEVDREAKRETKQAAKPIDEPDGQKGTLEIESESETGSIVEALSKPMAGASGKRRRSQAAENPPNETQDRDSHESGAFAEPAQGRTTRAGLKSMQKPTSPRRTRRGAASAA